MYSVINLRKYVFFFLFDTFLQFNGPNCTIYFISDGLLNCLPLAQLASHERMTFVQLLHQNTFINPFKDKFVSHGLAVNYTFNGLFDVNIQSIRLRHSILHISLYLASVTALSGHSFIQDLRLHTFLSHPDPIFNSFRELILFGNGLMFR